MLSPTEKFNAACSKWRRGKRLNPIPIEWRNILESQREIAGRRISGGFSLLKKPIEVIFDYLDNPKLNAHADLIGGDGYIAINLGTIKLLFDLFQRMLAHPMVLPEIGDCEQEVVNSQHSDGIQKDWSLLESLRISRSQLTAIIQPRNELRRDFAQLADVLVFDFLFLHEYGHIARGHLDYYEAANETPLICEIIEATALSEPEALLRQAMEADADVFATHQCVGDFLKTEISTYPKEMQPLIDTPQKRFFMWNFALAGLFHLWGLSCRSDNISVASHPPTGIRYSLVRTIATEVAESIYPDLSTDLRDTASRGFVELRKSILPIGGDHRGIDDLPSSSSPVLVNRIREIVERLQKFYVEIEPFDRLYERKSKQN